MSNLAVSASSQIKIDSPHLLGLPEELLNEHIFFFADRSESLKNGLVCRAWRILTISAWRKSNQHDLKQVIHLLKSQNHFKAFASQATEIYNTFCTTHNNSLTTPEQIDQSFWAAVGKIIGIFNIKAKFWKQAKRAIGDRLPNSLKDIFEIGKLPIDRAIRTQNFRTFSIVFHIWPSLSDLNTINARISAVGHTPLSNNDLKRINEGLSNAALRISDRRKSTVTDALRTQVRILRALKTLESCQKKMQLEVAWKGIKFNNMQLVQLVFESSLVSDSVLVKILQRAFKKNRVSVCPLFSAERRISKFFSKCRVIELIKRSFKEHKIEFFRVSLALLPVLDDYKLIEILNEAIEEGKDEFTRALIARNPDLDRHVLPGILVKLIEKDKDEFVSALIARGPVLDSYGLRKILVKLIEKDKDEFVSALIARGPVLDSYDLRKILLNLIENGNDEFARALIVPGSNLNPDDLTEILKKGVENGRDAVVLALADHFALESHQLAKIFKKAIKQNNTGLIQSLIDRGLKLNVVHLQELIEYAKKENKNDIVQLLAQIESTFSTAQIIVVLTALAGLLLITAFVIKAIAEKSLPLSRKFFQPLANRVQIIPATA